MSTHRFVRVLADISSFPFSFVSLLQINQPYQWIASTDCDSCRDAPAIWDPTRSSTAERATTAGDFNMNYLRGAVAGPVYWEQLTIGGYTILHQAMGTYRGHRLYRVSSPAIQPQRLQ